MFRERKLTDDFCWKGIWASQMGVIVTQQVQYHRPALRREAITVPGRSGTLRPLGNDAYAVSYTHLTLPTNREV